MARARQGDAEAFARLCEQHRGRLGRIAASVARGADAEDLAQEAVVRAWRGLSGYQGEAPFATWLCRIAVNLAHDHLKSAWRRRVRLFDLVPKDGDATGQREPAEPAGLVEQRELQRRVRQAVASLPEPQRVPVWLHYFEGFALAEVARLEGIPEATVRSRVKAGLKRMSMSLDDLLPTTGEECRPLEARPKGCGA